jgi:hypothetical protein
MTGRPFLFDFAGVGSEINQWSRGIAVSLERLNPDFRPK